MCVPSMQFLAFCRSDGARGDGRACARLSDSLRGENESSGKKGLVSAQEGSGRIMTSKGAKLSFFSQVDVAPCWARGRRAHINAQDARLPPVWLATTSHMYAAARHEDMLIANSASALFLRFLVPLSLGTPSLVQVGSNQIYRILRPKDVETCLNTPPPTFLI